MTAALSDGPLERLLGRLSRLRQVGENQWQAQCPAHDDRTPSLRVSTGSDGRVLVCCHAGCETRAVVEAVGLTLPDLFSVATAVRVSPSVRRRHIYCDGDGTPVYAIERLDHDGQNRFRTVHREGQEWVKGHKSGERFLYRLPELVDTLDGAYEPGKWEPGDPVVWVCEGERDADTAWDDLGVPATTVASRGWAAVDLSVLTGRAVLIVADADAPGVQHAGTAYRALESAGAIFVDEYPEVGGDWVLAPVWEGVKDLTDLVAAIRNDEGFKAETSHLDDHRVALLAKVVEALRPFRQDRGDTRTLGDRTRGFFGQVPGELLVSDAPDLAVRLFALLDTLALSSRIAKVTNKDLERELNKGEKQVAKAIKWLTDAGLVTRVKRGQYRVDNPARQNRR